MNAAMIVIPLVALVIPISLLLIAVVFDVGVLAWALYRVWHDRVYPRVVGFADRAIIAARLTSRQHKPRLVYHK